MTIAIEDHERRIEQLEYMVNELSARLDEAEKRTNFFRVGVSVDGVPYLMTEGRLGIMTDFWCKMKRGQGAALSIGTEVDRFAVYAEIDKASCPDFPSVAVYASVVAPNKLQYNEAIQAHAANSSMGNGAVVSDADYDFIQDEHGVFVINRT